MLFHHDLLLVMAIILAIFSLLELATYTLLLSIILSHRRDVGGQEFGGMYCAILIVK